MVSLPLAAMVSCFAMIRRNQGAKYHEKHGQQQRFLAPEAEAMPDFSHEALMSTDVYLR